MPAISGGSSGGRTYGITAQAASNVAGPMLGEIVAGFYAKHKNAQTLGMQQKFNEMAMRDNKAMALFNQQLDLDTWAKTGPVGQMEQLKKAGLNPALMYGMGGAGGQTVGHADAQGVSTGHAEAAVPGSDWAGMGLQLASQLQLIKAQTDNIKADTKNKEAQATKTSGVDTQKAGIEIQSLSQGINESQARQGLIQAETEYQKLDNAYKSGTLEQSIANYANDASRIWAQAQSAMTQADVDRATKETRIKQFGANLTETLTGIALKDAQTDLARKDIDLKDEQIYAISTSLKNAYTQMSFSQETQLEDELHKSLDATLQQMNLPGNTAKEVGERILQALMLGGLLRQKGKTTIEKYSDKDGYEHQTIQQH